MVEHSLLERTRRRRPTTSALSSAIAGTAVALVVGVMAIGSVAGTPAARAASVPTAALSAAHHATGVPGSNGRSAASTPFTTTSTTGVVAPPTPVVAVTPTTAAAPTPTPTTALPATPAPPVPVPVVSSPAASTATDLASLVAQVESAGIAPGPTWSWSIGDTSRCGAIPGTNVGTGCTSGAAGSVTTVLAGAPGLLLVAHELANAETENYAVPALVDLVARDAGGTSWSAIDAVATCLVVHFMHVQDGAAGSWTCPAGLADVVGAHIHDATFTG